MTTTAAPASRATPHRSLARNVSSNRESVESFVVVFLILLVLGVEAEGFVIPTGSMAPTLMGRHKEVTCPECGFVYTVDGNREIEGPGTADGSVRIVAGVCVNCRFQAPLGDEPNFQGDRIYVIKTPLSLPFVPSLGTARPKRWDIAVFKLPEDPEVRYIKRMVGMPDETLRILRGDAWVGPREGSGPFRRPERPLAHQDAMLIVVCDDSHRPRTLRNDPRWSRWATREHVGWQEHVDEPGVYRSGPQQEGWINLRYRHVVPDPVQWDAIRRGQILPHPPRATLVTDFYAYNTEMTNDAEGSAHPVMVSKPWRQAHWVGDLTLAFTLELEQPKGTLRVELVKAGVSNRVEIDLATRRATIWHGETKLEEALVPALMQPGPHALRFSNVDDRLSLRVDKTLPFGDGVRFVADPAAISPTAADLDPAGVAVKGAVDATIRDLVLSRDIYYTLRPGRIDYDSLELDDPLPTDPVALFDWLADPKKFAAFGKLGPRDFPIAPGRYMMLGDNSPWSRDGRDWLHRPDRARTARPGLGRLGSGKLGGSRSPSGRQGVLRLLASSQAGLARLARRPQHETSRPPIF